MQLGQKELTEGPDKASGGVKSKFPKSIAEIQPPFGSHACATRNQGKMNIDKEAPRGISDCTLLIKMLLQQTKHQMLQGDIFFEACILPVDASPCLIQSTAFYSRYSKCRVNGLRWLGKIQDQKTSHHPHPMPTSSGLDRRSDRWIVHRDQSKPRIHLHVLQA